jgi:hypothetical protein
MSPDLAAMIERVRRLREELTRATPTKARLAEVEDVLTEGYARALNGDAWSTRTEQRLHELISDAGAPVRGGYLRAVATDHAGFQRDLIELRRQLTELWHARDRLRERIRAPSA